MSDLLRKLHGDHEDICDALSRLSCAEGRPPAEVLRRAIDLMSDQDEDVRSLATFACTLHLGESAALEPILRQLGNPPALTVDGELLMRGLHAIWLNQDHERDRIERTLVNAMLEPRLETNVRACAALELAHIRGVVTQAERAAMTLDRDALTLLADRLGYRDLEPSMTVSDQ